MSRMLSGMRCWSSLGWEDNPADLEERCSANAKLHGTGMTQTTNVNGLKRSSVMTPRISTTLLVAMPRTTS